MWDILLTYRCSFSKFAQLYHRDKLKSIDFNDFDTIYMITGALSNVNLGCMSKPVGGI